MSVTAALAFVCALPSATAPAWRRRIGLAACLLALGIAGPANVRAEDALVNRPSDMPGLLALGKESSSTAESMPQGTGAGNRDLVMPTANAAVPPTSNPGVAKGSAGPTDPAPMADADVASGAAASPLTQQAVPAPAAGSAPAAAASAAPAAGDPAP